jgi:hypothetical protein
VPETLSTCLTEADLDFYANEFKRTGFRGGLNWYRNIDRLGTDAISQRSQDSPTFALHSRRARQRNHDLSARFRQLRGNYAGLEKEGFVAGWVTTTVRYLRGGGLKSAGCGELHVRGGFLSVRGDIRNNQKPQPAKTVLPNKHSMDTLVVFLATFDVLIWGYNAVIIAGTIGSIISGGIVI